MKVLNEQNNSVNNVVLYNLVNNILDMSASLLALDDGVSRVRNDGYEDRHMTFQLANSRAHQNHDHGTICLHWKRFKLA